MTLVDIFANLIRQAQVLFANIIGTQKAESPRDQDIEHDETVPAVTQTSLFFKLPAELRIQIYEYALYRDDWDDEDENDDYCRSRSNIEFNENFQQPPLLLTCRQVRSEAIEVFYTITNFLLYIDDCDPTQPIAFCRHLRLAGFSFSEAAISYQICVSGDKDTRNLMKWCRAVWEGKCPAFCNEDGDGFETVGWKWTDEVRAVVFMATTMVEEYRDLGQSWEKCEKALQRLRVMVGTLDGSWLGLEGGEE
jgi:hypothetical protein